jgi:hypothetical protein
LRHRRRGAAEAIELVAKMSLSPTFEAFLTVPAYRLID